MLRKFYRTYAHRVELDSNGMRFFTIPQWRAIPWAHLRSVTEDGEGIQIQGAWPTKPVRIEREVESFLVICRLIEQLKTYREAPDPRDDD